MEKMNVNYDDLIERMKRAGTLKNDSAVARVLDVTPQALSNYKKRGKMPLNLVLKFVTIYNCGDGPDLSFDWLLLGKGPAPWETKKEPEGLEPLVNLTPDELVVVGKVLRIMRTPVPVIKEVFEGTIEHCFEIVNEKTSEEQAA